MAREHARLLVSIWSDDDWVRLSSVQQMTYLALISSPDLSWCGVVPLLPQRLSRLASDLSERKVRAALSTLEAERFLIIDEETAEVAVRSFVRHDGILKQPNVAKALVRALGLVHSKSITRAIKGELSRELRDNPSAKGWASIQSIAPELFGELQAKASRNPSANPLRKAS